MSPRLDAPIIIVGNGGSGTTLLDRTLDAHPNIVMLGEMKYLVADAWSAFNRADANTILRNLAQYFDTDPRLEARIKSTSDAYGEFISLVERDENCRRANLMRRIIAEWFCLNTSQAQVWGFKEITNNGARKWDSYDLIFPAARWVHVIRHPVDWLYSAARLSGQSLSAETIPNLLKTWTDTVEMSRQRSSTGRYYEIKYEDLHSNPKDALAPLFGGLGLTWHDECRSIAQQQWGARSDRPQLPAEMEELLSITGRIEVLMAEYGYSPKDLPPLPEIVQTPPMTIEPAGDGRFKLVNHIFNDGGHCWIVDLSNAAVASELSAMSDDIYFWERSSLRLFEDDRLLGPAHALHYQIRRDGGGRYSHWQSRLLFSTFDNTNPNSNGRVYTFDYGRT